MSTTRLEWLADPWWPLMPFRFIHFEDGRRFALLLTIDIGSTNEKLAATVFEMCHADGVIIPGHFNLFPGTDAIEPFLKYGKPVWVSIMSSDTGPDSLIRLITDDGRPYWQRLADVIEEYGRKHEHGD
jgi:hypothetical protein